MNVGDAGEAPDGERDGRFERAESPSIVMSYEKRKAGSVQVAMGDALSDLIACGKSAVGVAAGGAVDPYLPEVFCRLSQLQALSKDRTPLQALFGKKPTVPVPVCTSTPPGKGGIGLERAVKPLRVAVFVNQQIADIGQPLHASNQ